jgi:hypothetical protein
MWSGSFLKEVFMFDWLVAAVFGIALGAALFFGFFL